MKMKRRHVDFLNCFLSQTNKTTYNIEHHGDVQLESALIQDTLRDAIQVGNMEEDRLRRKLAKLRQDLCQARDLLR